MSSYSSTGQSDRTAAGSTGATGTTPGAGGTGTRSWRDYEDTYRADYESRYGSNRSWDEHGPAYRYGWERAQEDRFRDRDYSAAERDLQGDFPDHYGRYRSERVQERAGGGHQGHDASDHQTLGGTAEHLWENFKDTVREGFDRARMDR
jgi:hypothetical protein